MDILLLVYICIHIGTPGLKAVLLLFPIIAFCTVVNGIFILYGNVAMYALASSAVIVLPSAS